MNTHYTYDEIYGILLNRNENDTERNYFVIEYDYWSFCRWMYQYGWNKIRDHPCERNEIRGYEVKLGFNK